MSVSRRMPTLAFFLFQTYNSLRYPYALLGYIRLDNGRHKRGGILFGIMASRLSQQEFNKRKRMFEQGFCWCSKCKQFRPIDGFAQNRNGYFGRYSWCKDCHSQKRRGDEQIKKYGRNRARYLTQYYTDLAGGCCQRCKYNKSVCALDFHHVNSNEKDSIAQTVLTTNDHEKIYAELNKCVLLCSNCHREYTAKLWVAEFVKRDGLGWTIKRSTIVKTDHEDYKDLPDKYRYSQLSLT